MWCDRFDAYITSNTGATEYQDVDVGSFDIDFLPSLNMTAPPTIDINITNHDDVAIGQPVIQSQRLEPTEMNSGSIESSEKSWDLQRLLACPFYVKFGVTTCFSGLKRVSDIRQHIHRKHMQPLHCSTCGVVFGQESSKNKHVQRSDCSPTAVSLPGATEAQWKCISSFAKGQPVRSDHERWYEIWDILFPNSPRPRASQIEVSSSELSRRVDAMIHKYKDSKMMQQLIDNSSLSARLGASEVRAMVEESLQHFHDFVKKEDTM